MVTCYYRSGPIERDPGASFHSKNNLDKIFTEEFGFKIVGDSFEHLKTNNCPQEIYGPKMKRLRDQGKIVKHCQNELLLVISFREIRKKAAFMVIKPGSEASGGTNSETAISWPRCIPKLVIVGPHHERILDNDSTFMIRMLNQGLFLDTEKDVIDFVREHIDIFRQGRKAIRQLIGDIKKVNPHINDRPKPLWDDRFESKTVILQGRPGCGKDTQGRLLQDRCGFKFVGSGYELRYLSNKITTMRESLKHGNLAPEMIIDYLITNRLLKIEKFESIVFAGTPKKIGEAQRFIECLGFFNRKPQVIILDIDEELARKRILLRRICEYCEISFCDEKLVEKPICPQCGGSLTTRMENTSEEAIEKIFNWYETDVEAVIRYFDDLRLVKHIDGNRSKEEIFNDILEILKR